MQRIQDIRHFACQSLFNTVKQKGGFKTLADYHCFAVSLGYTGLSMPVAKDVGYDLGKALKHPDYFRRLSDELGGYGYTNPLERVEAHTTTQPRVLSWTRPQRFAAFVRPKNWKKLSVHHIEMASDAQIRQLIDVCSRDGIKKIIVFLGGKGYGVGQAKWSAWPQYFGLWVLATLAAKWQALFEYAADKGVVLYHEAFHPESDIMTGANWVTFYNMLSDKAKKGAGVLLDISHLLNVGVDPIPHVMAVLSTGCKVQVHCKGGVVFDYGEGNTQPLGGWQDWSEASNTFVTVGTFEKEETLRTFYRLIAERHAVDPDGVDLYYEAECVILNMLQGMEIGYTNVLALRDDTKLARIPGYPVVYPSEPTESREESRLIVMPDGTEVPIGKILVPFDKCFRPGVLPWELMKLTDRERAAARRVLRLAGYEKEAALRRSAA